MNSKTTTDKTPRAPRKAKTAAEIKAQMEKLKEQLAQLELTEHAEELKAVIAKLKLQDVFANIKSKIKGVTDIAILTAIGKELGITRLSITQAEPKKRAPRSSAKVK